jgi:hypothetical protein
VFSARERALLGSVLAHVRAEEGSAPDVDALVARRLTDAIGRAVMQRAISEVGAAVLERIVSPYLGPVIGAGPVFRPPGPHPQDAPVAAEADAVLGEGGRRR